MPTRHIASPPANLLAGPILWWLYNVSMLMGLVLFCPLLIALAVGQKKRRHTFRRRLSWRRTSGKSSDIHGKPVIWVHGLSVGEVTAAQPLIQSLEKRYAGHRIVLTASTLTGYQTADQIFADVGVELDYFPYDFLFSVRAAADKIDPQIVILIETDIWPNFLCEMQRRRVPVFLANFRLSDVTWRRYRSFGGCAGKLFKFFEKIFAQTSEDGRRLQRLGVSPQRICVTGNLKFDMSGQLQKQGAEAHWQRILSLEPDRMVIVAGSTHEGDETIVLKAFLALRKVNPGAKLIIAPRNPGRSSSIATLCADRGMRCRELSTLQSDAAVSRPDVVVVDFIGVLKELYAVATVAFIGGSLSHEGGHNPLEPAAYGKPVLFGPDMRDFRQIAAWLKDMKGASQISGATQLGQVLLELYHDPDAAKAMGRRAQAVFESHKGAVAKTIDHLGLH